MADKITAITLPKLGLTMETGSVAAWHVDVGATVTEGMEVADIETEKTTIAYESPVAGVWRESVVEVGKEVPVGSLIGVVADADVSDADIEAFVSNFVPEEMA